MPTLSARDRQDASHAARATRATGVTGDVVLERLDRSVSPAPNGLLPLDAAEAFRDLPGLVLLESGRGSRAAGAGPVGRPSDRWTFLTADSIAVSVADEPGTAWIDDARAALGRLADGPLPGPTHDDEREVAPFAGGLVGYLAYELGGAWERPPAPLWPPSRRTLPLVRLALHDWVVAWDGWTGACWLGGRAVDGDRGRLATRLDDVRARLRGAATGHGRSANADAVRGGVGPGVQTPQALRFRSRTSRAGWIASVEGVRHAIGRGEIYQANLTRRLAVDWSGDPWPLYRALSAREPAPFGAFLDLGRLNPTGGGAALLSASPEPFLRLDPTGLVATDPIKGTRRRGASRDQDRAFARELLASDKDRAENLMIVDVLRNDLGRVCVPGSVGVPRRCRLERTPHVQHLVSRVTGRLAPDRDAFDLLAATLPGGSISGAPKQRALELIAALEPVPRGPYSGAIGWIGADGAMATSIAIRTFVADGESLSLHVGGGITWRSDPEAEWDETVAKAAGPLAAIGAVEVEGGR